MPQVQIKRNPSGMFELYKDGKRTFTGTEQAVSQMASRIGGSAGATPEGSTTPTDPIATSGIRRHITQSTEPTLASQFSDIDTTLPTPQEEEDIRLKTIEDVQNQIDNINQIYAGLISKEETAGAGRLGQQRSISARSGVLGGEFGAQAKKDVQEFNVQQIESLQAEKGAKIGAILSNAEDRASQKIQAERELATSNKQAFLQFQADQVAQARADVKDLAKSGISLADLSDEEYTSLLSDTEMSPVLFEATYNANLPKNEQADYSYINVGGGKIVRVNKAGGEPEEFDFSTPDGFEFRMAGDTPVFINESTQEVILADTGAGTGEDITDLPTEEKSKKLSINQIEQFRRSYGWTPPFGYSMSQLEQYIADNPDATPEELELGAQQVAGITATETTKPTLEGGTQPSGVDMEAKAEVKTADEIINSIVSDISDEQLKKMKEKADEADISKWFKGKKTDVKNYLKSIKDKIQTAIDSGWGQEEIINFLIQ